MNGKTKNLNPIFTKKQRKFFEYVSMGFNHSEAAKKAGYKQPRSSAAQNINSYTLAFRHAFNTAGFNILDVVENVIEGTKAMRTISAVNTGKEASGATCDFIDVPDWNARHKFIDTAIKLQGFYPAEKHELSGKDGEPIPVTFYIPERKNKNNE